MFMFFFDETPGILWWSGVEWFFTAAENKPSTTPPPLLLSPPPPPRDKTQTKNDGPDREEPPGDFRGWFRQEGTRL